MRIIIIGNDIYRKCVIEIKKYSSLPYDIDIIIWNTYIIIEIATHYFLENLFIFVFMYMYIVYRACGQRVFWIVLPVSIFYLFSIRQTLSYRSIKKKKKYNILLLRVESLMFIVVPFRRKTAGGSADSQAAFSTFIIM